MKEKIRPVYQELQGYLSQTPIPQAPYESIGDESIWNQLNQSIDELNEVTGKDYSKFKVYASKGMTGESINIAAYRSKLGGLIDRLHAEYFVDEPKPFSSTPTTIISQGQFQEQSTQVFMLLEVQEKILKRLSDENTTLEEKNFLKKLKENLGSVRSVVELIGLILSTARAMNINLDSLINLLK